jgi:hypothetical protein
MNVIRFFGCIVLLALATGCPHKPVTLTLADDPKTATEQIQNLIPLGMTATNAELMMQQQGFVCSIKHGDFQDGSNVVKNADFIYCDKSEGSIVQRRYQVALVLTDSKVSAVKLSSGLVGP